MKKLLEAINRGLLRGLHEQNMELLSDLDDENLDQLDSLQTKSVNNNIKVLDNHIQLPKLGKVKFAKSREVRGNIINATIRRNPSGRYFVTLTCEIEEVEYLPKIDKKVGVDVGLKDFAITSDGVIFKNPKCKGTLGQNRTKCKGTGGF